eukprot:CAMPEP_0119053972 /NCGR_PEP_ID=MMETSP1177-20130426/74765_1 /TAXON_ID=2985 /ORGANISM="Ochromonas sp, Strain CCMP1899" /LENGTH=213 /DNA_ID=CAMNT_0007034065 /DNA_START=705 /DNA_END=1347 /DNA_ORIENTATION=+
MSIVEIKAMRSSQYVLLMALFYKPWRLIAGGIVTGAGISVMHYLGVMAMIVEDTEMPKFNAGIVTASVLISIVAAIIAYWILFRLLALYPYIELLRLISAATISVGVNAMHYTGMAAARTESSDHLSQYSKLTVNSDTAMYASMIASTFFLWGVVLLIIADLRMWFYAQSKKLREIDDMMRDLEAAPINYQATQTAVKRYKIIREQDAMIQKG